ncbi:TPA: hypothetical protein ACG8SP_000779, partial [Enterococcus faecium]
PKHQISLYKLHPINNNININCGKEKVMSSFDMEGLEKEYEHFCKSATTKELEEFDESFKQEFEKCFKTIEAEEALYQFLQANINAMNNRMESIESPLFCINYKEQVFQLRNHLILMQNAVNTYLKEN